MNAIANNLITLGFTIGIATGGIATGSIATGSIATGSIATGSIATMAPMPHQTEQMPSDQTSEFQRIEQPIGAKIAVSIAGLGLIGLELWWFLFSRPDRQA